MEGDNSAQGVQVDTVQFGVNGAPGGIRVFGSVAQRMLQSGFDSNSLRTNEVLMKDEWIQFDDAVTQVARQRLVTTAGLISRGLVHNIPDGLATTVLQWENVSDMSPANVSMSGVTPGDEDRMIFELLSMPLPITHKSFRINIRNLLATRRNKSKLDTMQAQLAGRLVAESIERSMYDGLNITSGGGTVYGLTNHPNRNTHSVTRWDLPGTTGTTIVSEILAMIDKLQADNMYGPYELHVPITVFNKFNEDFKTESDRTILERLSAIPQLDTIRATNFLSSGGAGVGEVVMFQATNDVIEVVDGMQPRTLQWDSEGGMVAHFKVMAIMLPRVRADYNDQSGIVHGTV